MRRAVLSTLLAAVGCAPLAAQSATLSKGDANELRDLFAAALLEPEGRALSKLLSTGRKLAKRVAFEDLLEALREGPRYPSGDPQPRGKGKRKEELGEIDGVTVGFTFEFRDERVRYAVYVPSDYDPEVPTPLLLDPGHGSMRDTDPETRVSSFGIYRNFAQQTGHGDWLVARTELIEEFGPQGRSGTLTDDELSEGFEAFFRDFATRFHVDPDRIYVSGLSQTGYWAWYLARARADRLAAIVPMGAVTFQIDAYLENVEHVRTHVIHGDRDPKCDVEQPRRTCAEMESRGYAVSYHEIEGGLHDATTWRHLYRGLEEVGEETRVRYPQRFTKRLQTESTPWAYWIRVDELDSHGNGRAITEPTAHVTAWIEDGDVRIESDGVKELTLLLSDELVDLDSDFDVFWNGKRKKSGPLERDFETTLRVAVERADWLLTASAAVTLK